jgi:hypothetical protein
MLVYQRIRKSNDLMRPMVYGYRAVPGGGILSRRADRGTADARQRAGQAHRLRIE